MKNIIYRRGTISPEHADTVFEAPQLNERYAEEYEHYLGIDIRELSGQVVLNIGCNKTGIFEKRAAQ